MPNIKSAKKRVKVIATKTARNKATKSALRTAVKKAYYAVTLTLTTKQRQFVLLLKKIDQAAAKGILHKNTAARSKSSLAKKDLTHQHKCNKSYRLKAENYSLLFILFC